MDSARHYPQDSYDSNNHEERAGFLSATEKHTQDNKSRYMLWAKVFWPLVAHGILTIIIGTLMVFYIDGGSFNLTERKPSVTLANGTTVPWSHYAPLQSDITTLVSSSLAILRLITAAWLGPLIWRCAFMLMEMPGGGLRPSELQTMISYGIPVLTRKGGRVIWLILAIVLPVHVIAPVLTGSITWVPHSQLVGQPSTSTIQVPAATRGSIRWRLWNVVAQSRERVCVQAIGLLNTAWGGSPDDSSPGNAMKRVVPSASQLEVNSTLSNVTIPYFSVTKLDWVKDPANTLGLNRLFPPTDDICLKVSLVDHPLSCVNMFDNVGAFALIPDTPPVWADNATFPSPLVVSETRLMILYVSSARRIGMTSYEPCQSLPNLIPYPPTSNTGCWAFARVTYTAGASECTNCRVSSRSTVQSDEALSVLGDPLTGLALRMMPTVISTMVALNTTTFSSEINPDDYIIKHLSRSYAASWNALTHHLSQTLPSLNTTYSAATPSSRAVVSLSRVYLWLGMQLLVTLSGAIFIWVQAKSTDELITDTTLVAFYLDSGDVSANHSELREGPLRKLEYGEEHLKVKIV